MTLNDDDFTAGLGLEIPCERSLSRVDMVDTRSLAGTRLPVAGKAALQAKAMSQSPATVPTNEPSPFAVVIERRPHPITRDKVFWVGFVRKQGSPHSEWLFACSGESDSDVDQDVRHWIKHNQPHPS